MGLIDDLEVCDLNGDSRPDLIAAGHWSPIRILINDGKKLRIQKESGLEKSNGLWNVVKAEDLDGDGDLDLVAGNWGLNTRLTASEKEPLKVYLKDFDNNGREEAIVTHFHGGVETVFSSKDELSKQLPSLNKKFLSYGDFARAGIEDLFGAEHLAAADIREVYTLEHSVFLNGGSNRFTRKKLPIEAQLSSVKVLYLHDFDGDGLQDLLLAGNDYNVSTQLGRQDAGQGQVLLNRGNGTFVKSKQHRPAIKGQARAISAVLIRNEQHLLVTRNSDSPVILNLNETHD